VERLLENLTLNPPPATVVSQFLPEQYHAMRRGEIGGQPSDLIEHKIMEITADYAYACGLSRSALQSPISNSNVQEISIEHRTMNNPSGRK
jgi:D-tagatose-1,6-bisphosphate aldolase subunit GatZ/KbaZ